ncbi:tripartite tricarboxylate transporter permease [Acidobacteriota bacterium]
MPDPILHAAWEAFLLVFSWPNILYPIIGTLLAMCFALMPGLTGTTLMALAIPLTLSWDPLPVILIFGAFLGGATFTGSVTAILFNIPGLASNAATLLDGYPFAQQGKAKTAISCSATASALGSTFGVIVLILLLPVMRDVILLFGPPEFLMLTIWGLTTIVVLSRSSVVKGLIMAGFGLLLSFVGFDPRTAELRYTFEMFYLNDGIDLIAVFIGLFALSEIIDLIASGQHTISGRSSVSELSGNVWDGIRSVFVHFGLFLRSSIIGTIIGIIPGIGATVSSFVAYGHAVQSARKDSKNFGKGDIRGIIAPEAANDAKDGGALVSTLAFGIPGGTGTALLLTVLAIHGLTPGREMLTTQLPLVFVLIWSLFFSNWLTSLFGLAFIRPLTRITSIRIHLIIPLILMTATVGAYIHRGRIEDVFVAYLFALFGYAMKKFGWPRIPLVIALVLGPLFENSFHLSLKLHQLGRINFFLRPIVLIILGLALMSLMLPHIRNYRMKEGERQS